MTDDGTRQGNPIPRFFPGERAPLRDPALDAFLAYWTGKCRNADVPRRSEIDPRGIEPLLANAFVAERIAPGLARLRLAGTHLVDLMGMEMRGMPLSALFEPPDRDALARHLVRLFDEPAWLRLDLSAPGGLLTPALKGTMLVLPLRSDLGDISRALGCLVTKGSTGRAPRRFRISGCRVTPVGPDAMYGGAMHGVQDRGDRARTPPPRSVPPRPACGERPYLRLVSGEPA